MKKHKKYKDLQAAFDPLVGHLKFDNKLYKLIKSFRLGWMQKADIYIEFLGGNMTGDKPIRFSTRDEELLFNDILRIDIVDVKERLWSTEGINTSWKVSRNPFNAMIVYIMWKFYKSRHINKRLLDEVIKELYYILGYKFVASLIYAYFEYDADTDIAKTTYEKLSNAFLLKRVGTWQGVFDHRAKDILKGGLHYDRVSKKLTVEEYIRVINDLEDRVRKLVINIYSVMMDVINNHEKIKTTSMLEDNGSGLVVKDQVDRPDKYIIYINSVVGNRLDFIDHDIIHLLCNVSKNLDKNEFTKTLIYITENMDVQLNKNIDFVSLSVNKTIEYMAKRGINSNYNGSVIKIIKDMKGYWGSSSVKDVDVIKTKKYLFDVTHEATGKKTPWLLTTIVINILIYIFIRALTKR